MFQPVSYHSATGWASRLFFPRRRLKTVIMLPRTSVGLEIAGQDLRIAVVRSFGRKRRLLRLANLTGFLPLSEEDRKRKLSSCIKQHNLPTSRVYLTLPNALGLLRDLEFPAEVSRNLRSAVALQVENLSPWPVDEIY